MPHERDVAVDAEELHGPRPSSSAGCCARQPLAGVAAGFHTWPIDTLLRRFCRPYQKFTRPRENITAENMEVRMPRQCTTAKPRTGPEPNVSSAMPAISVVTFESRMVAHARS